MTSLDYDVNDDGETTLFDVNVLAGEVMDMNPVDDQYDYTGDGTVDVADMMALKEHIAGDRLTSSSDPLADYSEAQIREAVKAIYSSSSSGPETSIGSDGLVHYEIGTGAGYPIQWSYDYRTNSGEVGASAKLLRAINAAAVPGDVEWATDAIRLTDNWRPAGNAGADIKIPTTYSVGQVGMTATEAVKTWLDQNAGRSESQQSTPSETVDAWEPDPAGEGRQTGSGIPTSDDTWREVSESETPTPEESAAGEQSSGGGQGLGQLPLALAAVVAVGAAALAVRGDF